MKQRWTHRLIAVLILFSCGTTETTAAESPSLATSHLTGPLHPLPDQTLFNSADVDLFWHAYDNQIPGLERTIFKNQYFDAGSNGLQDFFHQKIRTTKSFYVRS